MIWQINAVQGGILGTFGNKTVNHPNSERSSTLGYSLLCQVQWKDERRGH